MPKKRRDDQLDLGMPQQGGTIHPVTGDGETPQLHFTLDNGRLYLGDSIAWLRTLEEGSVDLVFADPPYNIKKAVWDSFDSLDQYVEWSRQWIKETARVLKPSGTLYVCGFSEILAHVKEIGRAHV